MIWEFAFVVFLLALTALVILLIPVVLQLKDSIVKLNSTLDMINKDLPEVMSNFMNVSKSLTVTTGKIEETIEHLNQMEANFKQQVQAPLKTIGNVVSSLVKISSLLLSRRKSR